MKKLKKKVISLHDKGLPMSEIAEELELDVDEVRAIVTGKWDEDKKKRSVEEKVAGRLGKGYFKR